MILPACQSKTHGGNGVHECRDVDEELIGKCIQQRFFRADKRCGIACGREQGIVPGNERSVEMSMMGLIEKIAKMEKGGG